MCGPPTNGVFALFVYSPLALVTTVATDETGFWQTTLATPLVSGNHTAYLAELSSEGKVVRKSSPFSFIVHEAHAQEEQVEKDQTPPQQLPPASLPQALTQNMGLYGILFGIALALMVTCVLIMHKLKKIH